MSRRTRIICWAASLLVVPAAMALLLPSPLSPLAGGLSGAAAALIFRPWR